MDKEYIYGKAISTWGTAAQIDMAIEECAELILALQKNKRFFGTYEVDDVIEEMADVEIMLEQLKVIYDYKYAGISKFERLKEYKLKRLKKRLE